MFHDNWLITLLLLLALLIGSNRIAAQATQDVDFEMVVTAYEQNHSTAEELFVGLDLGILVFQDGLRSQGTRMRFRQLSRDSYRLDDANTVIAQHNNFAFEAKTSGGGFYFTRNGFDNRTVDELKKKAFDRLMFSVVATSGSMTGGTLDFFLTPKEFESCTQHFDQSGRRVWKIISGFELGSVDFADLDGHSIVEVLPDSQFFAKSCRLFAGNVDASNQIELLELFQRPDKKLKKDEMLLIKDVSTSYQHFEGRMFPNQIRGELPNGYLLEIESIRNLDSDPSIFTPESIGLETPERKHPLWVKWAILSFACFIVSLVFFYRVIRI